MKARHTCTFHEGGSKTKGYRWRNPDGSVGGWVAETAQVDPTATVEFTAFVVPGQVVKAGEIVHGEEGVLVE